ncbi:hypothetical protein LCGC14_2131370 [marine sediment metagenome]|uniref:Uncharacterized protein n=1 Tax=marine sediment metagenome TaxID=412755 RepID=A0A0F9E1A3_9ZZZZ
MIPQEKDFKIGKEKPKFFTQLVFDGNSLSWHPCNPINPEYIKDLLFNNREDMIPLKFLDWFVKNRHYSHYVNSFRKVRGHVKKLNKLNWRTPFDRDPTTSKRVKMLYKIISDAKKAGTLGYNAKDFYVIYALVQKRNLFTGIELSRIILEIGKTTSRSMPQVRASHATPSKALIGNVYFALNLFKIFKETGVISKNAIYDDYFEAIPIDIAATKKQRDNLEIFYTIYLNRQNGRYSFNLEYNLLFNAIVSDYRKGNDKAREILGDIGKMPSEPEELRYVLYTLKENLESAILLGLEAKDLMWYFKVSERYVSKIWKYHYPNYYNFEDIRKVILTSHLIDLAKSGVYHSNLVNYFYSCKTTAKVIKSSWRESSFQPNIAHFTKSKVTYMIKKYLGSIGKYNEILLESYLKPKLITMYNQGIITKERLLGVLIGALELPIFEGGYSRGLSGTAFNWIFQLLFSTVIINALSKKNYGKVTNKYYVPIELVHDLGFYIDGKSELNDLMKIRLFIIIESMFGTADLSQIYLMLNTGTL